MIIQIAEAKKLLKDIESLHDETITSLKAEIAKLENELLEARKANIEMAKVALDRYFEIKHLKEANEKKDKDIDDLNASIFKVTQESMEKDKTIEAQAEQVKELKLAKENKLFLLDDEGTPIKSFTLIGKLTLMEEPAKEKLEVGKWYDARTFEVEKLKELLPAGTRVAITTDLSEDEQRIREPKSCIRETIVTKVDKARNGTAFYVIDYQTIENYWFKIIKE